MSVLREAFALARAAGYCMGTEKRANFVKRRDVSNLRHSLDKNRSAADLCHTTVKQRDFSKGDLNERLGVG